MKKIDLYITEKLKLSKDIESSNEDIDIGDSICLFYINEQPEKHKLKLTLAWTKGFLKKEDYVNNDRMVVLQNLKYSDTTISGKMFINKNGFCQINDNDNKIYLILKPDISLIFIEDILIPLINNPGTCTKNIFQYFDKNHRLFQEYKLSDIIANNSLEFIQANMKYTFNKR